jgi:hypothetical protein
MQTAKTIFRTAAIAALTLLAVLIFQPARSVGAQPNFQETVTPTSTKVVPTVTGTPIGTFITVNGENDQINIRECPNTTTCKIVGVLLAGQQVPAKGRTEGGMWIEIVYPGVPGGLAWVHSSLVSLGGGTLPIIEPPATPTPLTTSTIDPTLAAQFVVTIQPSRLPTYTYPAPLEVPTFEPVSTNSAPGNLPMGMIILSLAALGLFGALLSVLQRR